MKPENTWTTIHGKRVRVGWRRCRSCNPNGQDVAPYPCTDHKPCQAGWRSYVIRRGTKMNGYHSTRHL